MNEFLITMFGCAIVVAAIIAIVRGVDVRLALLLAGLAMCGVAGDVSPILRSFLTTISDEKYIIPIGTALGFAHVLRQSECDRHLVMLLLKPAQFAPWLLIPGSLIVGFLVNIAVISQAGTAIAVATVLVPLLRSIGMRPPVIGATLVLGASVGGELLNPGAPELQSVVKHLSSLEMPADPRSMQPILAPLLLVQLGVAIAVFWWQCSREPRDCHNPLKGETKRLNLAKAIVPLLPLALLFMAGAPLNWFHIPEHWIVDPARPEPYVSRLIGAAMIAGSIAAVLVAPSMWRNALRTFFEGVAYAMANIISIITAANCFGAGIKALNLASWVGTMTHVRPGAIWPVAGALSMLFAVVSGSGMAATESLFRFFGQSGWSLERNLAIGAVTSIAGAAGRTTSPAAAVLLVCAPLVGVNPMEIVRRVAGPMLIATAVTIGVAFMMH